MTFLISILFIILFIPSKILKTNLIFIGIGIWSLFVAVASGFILFIISVIIFNLPEIIRRILE